MKENSCVITTFNLIGNDLESLPITGNAQNVKFISKYSERLAFKLFLMQ